MGTVPHMDRTAPIVLTGRLGWGNGDRMYGASPYDLYGPGGRWGSRPSRPSRLSTTPRPTPGAHTQGDHMADALVEAGAGEGTPVVVLALPRGTTPEQMARVSELVLRLVDPRYGDYPLGDPQPVEG